MTDNGIQFTNRTVDKHAWMHIFDRICYEHNIEHRLTKINHPWTNGQVERMNRTIKEATVKRFYYDNYQQLNNIYMILSMPTIDLFRNSTSAGDLYVDPVLESSRTLEYAAVRGEVSPSNPSAQASFEGGLISQKDLKLLKV